jgi:hypothetical protein
MKLEVSEVGCDSVYCVQWAQDRDKWRAVVTTEVNVGVPCQPGQLLPVRVLIDCPLWNYMAFFGNLLSGDS